MTAPKLTSLGWANGWNGYPPQELEQCTERGHERQSEPVGQNGTTHRYWCEVCGFEYFVDSSD